MKKRQVKRANSRREVEPIGVIPIKEERELLSWRTLARPYQKRDRDFWVTVLATVGLVSVILFLVGEVGLITTLLALLFFYYVLTTVEPETVDYRITTKGVYLPGLKEKLDWDWLRSFYFVEKWGYQLVKIETHLVSYPLVSLMVLPEKKEELVSILKRFLPEGQEKFSFVDKLSRWIYGKLPFEIEKKSPPPKEAKGRRS